MAREKRILIFAGSIRNGAYNRKLAAAAAEVLRSLGTEITFADLRDYPMPLYDGDLESASGLPERAKEFKELMREHDAFVIASPEYNGSFSALLKNTLDWASRPEPGERPLAAFRGKTAALLSASPGAGGGRRGLRHLRELLEMMGVIVLPGQLNIAKAHDAFDSSGRLARGEDRGELERVAAGLVEAVGQKETAAADIVSQAN
jgi:NAD(P)H-dependent FMN reductase